MSGAAANGAWDSAQVRELRKRTGDVRAGLFELRLALNGKRLTIIMEFDFVAGRVDYKTTFGSGQEEGFMRAQWRDEQERCERDIERHRAADGSYMDQGIQILNLGQNAHHLFARQPAKEKRSLLNFLPSNSTWAQGKLTVEFKEPFDLLIETVDTAARVEATQGAESAKNEV